MSAPSKSYPVWKYHAVEPARIVRSHFEEDALGPEWLDEPFEAALVAEALPAEPLSAAEQAPEGLEP